MRFSFPLYFLHCFSMTQINLNYVRLIKLRIKLCLRVCMCFLASCSVLEAYYWFASCVRLQRLCFIILCGKDSFCFCFIYCDLLSNVAVLAFLQYFNISRLLIRHQNLTNTNVCSTISTLSLIYSLMVFSLGMAIIILWPFC